MNPRHQNESSLIRRLSLWLPRCGIVSAAVALAMSAVSASAQPLGAFSWQLQPYCNVVTVNVVQTGPAIYTMDGWDDQCGGTTRAPLVGTATLNPDGSVGFGLNITTTPGGVPVTVDATISIVGLSGSWRDSAGHNGHVRLRGRDGWQPAAPGGPDRQRRHHGSGGGDGPDRGRCVGRRLARHRLGLPAAADVHERAGGQGERERRLRSARRTTPRAPAAGSPASP